jgi:tetratricopeptide (TPR) repeat protein
LHEASGQDDLARAAYAVVLSAQPDWALAYFFRATPLRRSVVAAAGLLAGAPPDPASGWAALAAGDLALAHARFGAASGLNTPDPYLGQGLAYLAEGRLPEAEYALRTARYVSDGQALLNVRTAFALGRVHVAQGRLDEALAEYRRGADILANVTSFGLGTLGTSEYAWYVFNRESVAADLLPGLDYILYTDDLVPGLVELSDLYRRLGDHTAAARLDCTLARAVPDDPVLQARLVDGVTCP